jgi:hypothetical protein
MDKDRDEDALPSAEEVAMERAVHGADDDRGTPAEG